MMKWLLLGIVLVLALWWISRGRRSGPEPDPPPSQPQREAGAPQPMVACAHCGVLLPVADAVQDQALGHSFCSAEHRRAGPRS